METEGEAVTMAQVNTPQTLFYDQNVNLVLQSKGGRCKISDAKGACTCNVFISKEAENDELSINKTDGVSLSDSETGIQRGVDVSQTASNISTSDSFNQRAADFSQNVHSVSINASASTDNKISINVNNSIQTNAGNGARTPATTDCIVSISNIGYDSDSTHVMQSASTSMSRTVSNSTLDCISDINFVSHSSSPSYGVSINTVSHSVSITPSNANKDAESSTKTSLRQTIRIRLPSTVCSSVRAYFSPTHTLTHTDTQ